MSGRTPRGPSSDQRRLVASTSVRGRGAGGKVLRKRLPTAAVALVCVAGLAAAITGAVSPTPVLDFVSPGHWVYNTVLHAALHVDGATAQVDARANVPGDPGSQVLQGDSSGYVVGRTDITVFGKSSLSVEGSVAAPSTEAPLGLQAPGAPYVIYRKSGKIVRLGDAPVTIAAGGPVGDPVFTSDGTLWFYREDTGALCPLPKDADRITVCPASVPSGHTGALTTVADRPMFLDTTASALLPFDMGGMAAAIPVGVPLSPQARPAPNDVSGRVAILDPATHSMHLVDPAMAAKPVTVPLPDGDYSGPTSTGATVAVVDRASDTVTTYDDTGKQRDTKALPANSGAPRLVRDEDGRVYVEGTAGTHVLVVDQDGGVTDVPAQSPTTKDKNAAPGGQPSTDQPERDERAAPNPPPSSSDTKPDKPTPPPATKPETSAVPPSPPGAPSGVSATAGSASATVHWGAAPDNRASITKYVVSWSGGSTTAAAAARSATISGLGNGKHYTFSVQAYNREGAGPAASTGSITPAGTAGAPTSLSAKASGSTVTVAWTSPSMNGGSLRHYSVTATGQSTKTTTGTSVTFPAPTSGSATYTVRAVTSAGTGATASTTYTVPKPTINAVRGDPTSSPLCGNDCGYVNVSLTGFPPNTQVTLNPETSAEAGVGGHPFDDPHTVTTDANGNASFDDHYESDMQDQYVWMTAETAGLDNVDSNYLYWD